jgi:hypothetical protein
MEGLTESGMINVSPNPVKQRFRIEFEAEESSNGMLIIRDLSGRKVMTSTLEIIELFNSNEVLLPEISPGAYSIQIISNRKTYFARFIVH